MVIEDSRDLQDLAPSGLRRFTRAEYDRLVDLGMFSDERIELLHGMMVQMSPQGPLHAYPLRKLIQILAVALGQRAMTQVQSPFAASDDSEPEPDLAVVPVGDYRREHPSSAHLVVEVAESSLRKDRLVKAPLYASSRVTEYWIILVDEGVVEVYRDARDGRYSRMETHGKGVNIAIVAFPDVLVRTDDFLP
jgi:Uma2 family endonuclease